MEFVVAAKKGQFLVVEPNGAKIAPADLKVTVKKGKIDLGGGLHLWRQTEPGRQRPDGPG